MSVTKSVTTMAEYASSPIKVLKAVGEMHDEHGLLNSCMPFYNTSAKKMIERLERADLNKWLNDAKDEMDAINGVCDATTRDIEKYMGREAKKIGKVINMFKAKTLKKKIEAFLQNLNNLFELMDADQEKPMDQSEYSRHWKMKAEPDEQLVVAGLQQLDLKKVDDTNDIAELRNLAKDFKFDKVVELLKVHTNVNLVVANDAKLDESAEVNADVKGIDGASKIDSRVANGSTLGANSKINAGISFGQ